MRTVQLLRSDGWSDDTCTTGRLFLDGAYVCNTIELPWLNNARSKSCIPLGKYLARRVKSRKFGPTFLVDVPGRSGILFHAGNSVADTRGCILLADVLVWPPSGLRGQYSKRAMSRFLKLLDGVQEFRLSVSLVLDGVSVT